MTAPSNFGDFMPISLMHASRKNQGKSESIVSTHTTDVRTTNTYNRCTYIQHISFEIAQAMTHEELQKYQEIELEAVGLQDDCLEPLFEARFVSTTGTGMKN